MYWNFCLQWYTTGFASGTPLHGMAGMATSLHLLRSKYRGWSFAKSKYCFVQLVSLPRVPPSVVNSDRETNSEPSFMGSIWDIHFGKERQDGGIVEGRGCDKKEKMFPTRIWYSLYRAIVMRGDSFVGEQGLMIPTKYHMHKTKEIGVTIRRFDSCSNPQNW